MARYKLMLGTIFSFLFVISIAMASPTRYTKVDKVYDADIAMSNLDSAFTFVSAETCYGPSTTSEYTMQITTPIIPMSGDTVSFILEISDADSTDATDGVAVAFDVTFLPTSPQGWFLSDTTTHKSGISVFSGGTYKGAYTKEVKVFYSANVKPTSPSYIYGKLSIWLGSTYNTKNGFHLTIYQVRKWQYGY